MNDPKFYTSAGLLTRYAFSCGYVERKGTLSLDMRHGVYHVVGFIDNVHVCGDFSHVKEARKFAAHPFTHTPSYDGSIVIGGQRVHTVLR